MNMLTKRQISAFQKKIEKHRDAVARNRDALNEAIGELKGLRDCCDAAWEDLQRAIDALSELA